MQEYPEDPEHDLPEDPEHDLPDYDELQRWYSGFVHLRHAYGFSKDWVRSIFKTKFRVWPREPGWLARRGVCPDEMRDIGIFPTAKIMRFSFKTPAAYFEAKFSSDRDEDERKKAALHADAARELLLTEVPPEADQLADESWSHFPQLAKKYDAALRDFQYAQKRLRMLSSGSYENGITGNTIDDVVDRGAPRRPTS